MRYVPVILSCLLAVAICTHCLAAPVCIEGVESMGWETKRFSLHIAALYSALNAMGCPMPYEELMVASGAAFRTAWWAGAYSYGSPDVAPEDLVLNGAAAAGAVAERRSFDSPEEVWTAVCESIDDGRPVVSWKGNGWGAQVICGYDPQGNRIHIRDYNTQGDQYTVLPFQSPGAPHPISTKNEIVLLSYDPNQGLPELDWPQILERAISFADRPAPEKLYGIFVFGLGAYDAWAYMLRRGVDHSGPQTDALLTEWVARVFSDARSAASVVLRDNVQLHDAFADAADHYMREAEILSDMAAVLSQGQGVAWSDIQQAMTANFPRQEVREQAAELVEQAKEEDVLAVDSLRLALKDLAGTGAGPEPVRVETVGPEPTVTVTPAPEPTAPSELAKQHCEKGRQLKAQHRYAEAAKELRAAIEADPNYVDAHWVLAWVLVELKDTDAAASEFRKVIELAPGSEKAKDAEKALERLGK